MTTIHGVSNIRDIGLLTYNNDIIYIEATIFKDYCTTVSNTKDNEKYLECDGDQYTAINSYFIANNDDNGKVDVAISSLIESSKKLKNILKEGIEFSINSGASHNNAKNSRVDFRNEKCTQFHKLRNMDDKKILDMKFKRFPGLKHWLSYFRSGTYDWYWRVYYRTEDDYYNYMDCSSNNLNLDNYNKNTNGCKTYIDNNKKQQWVANTCVREKISESNLFGICNQQLVSDLVDTKDKIEIIKKQMEWCKEGDRLLDKDLSGRCRIFWNTNYNNYYRENERKTILDKNVKDNLCKPGHNNYPFCNCINNEKNTVQYTDATGKKIKVPDICLKDYCQDESYKTSDYNQTSNCPSQCIQIAEGKYATLKDVTQSCTINQAEQTKKTDITEESNNLIPGVGTIIDNNVPKDKSKSSLFNLQNDNIKSFMNQLNINTIETSSYLLNEEDIFILGIIFIFILLFIISKVTGRKSEPNYSYYPNQMYYDSYPNQMNYPNQIYYP